MEWRVKNALSRDVEREHLNKILKEIQAKMEQVPAPSPAGAYIRPPSAGSTMVPARLPVTVTLTGDVTGTARGTGNITIETTLVNDGDELEDAPMDGQSYWRRAGEWEAVGYTVEQLQYLDLGGLVVMNDEGEWSSVSIEGAEGEIDVENGNGFEGNPLLSLADVEDEGGGTLQKTEFDSKGRKTGTSAATTDDLEEGDDNLYFTDERAVAALEDLLDEKLDYDSLKDVLVAGSNITLTTDDISETITITSTGGGGGGGGIEAIIGGTGISVDNTVPEAPVVALTTAVQTIVANAVVPSTTPTDGDILEYNITTGDWVPKKNPRELLIDGGNF